MSTTLCTLNLNGIRSAERRGFLRWIARAKPDVLCLQELRATPQDVEDELRAMGGWHSCWFPAVKKGYAGTAVCSRKPPQRFVAGLGFDYLGNEGRAVRADFDAFSVISLYIPSGSSGPERQAVKFQFLEQLTAWMKELRREKRPIAVCGDFNIAPTALDLARPKANEKNSGFLPEERRWLDELFGTHAWTDTFREVNGEPDQYTWWSNRGQAWAKNVGWRIDYQIGTPGLKGAAGRAAIYKDTRFSDHAPLVMDFDLDARP